MATFADLANIVIDHNEVLIRAYQAEDFAQLAVQFDPQLFTWFFTSYTTCEQFVAEKMADMAQSKLVMLVIIDKASAKIIGTTSLYEISLRHKRLEMGSTWLGTAYHGCHYNALIKQLLLDYLFGKLGFNRVQWKTDALNLRSQAAMTKLGLIFEGTLRRHAVTSSGRIRDSLVFAVTDLDWPQVKMTIAKRIQAKLNR